jgi:hypothetical protein
MVVATPPPRDLKNPTTPVARLISLGSLWTWVMKPIISSTYPVPRPAKKANTEAFALMLRVVVVRAPANAVRKPVATIS